MFFRTDMAIERRDLFKSANNLEDEINGIECEEEKLEDYVITRVKIKNKEGENALNKRIGNYITIDMKKINNITEEAENRIINAFSKELINIIDKHVKRSDEILIVGLRKYACIARFFGSKSCRKY